MSHQISVYMVIIKHWKNCSICK